MSPYKSSPDGGYQLGDSGEPVIQNLSDVMTRQGDMISLSRSGQICLRDDFSTGLVGWTVQNPATAPCSAVMCGSPISMSKIAIKMLTTSADSIIYRLYPYHTGTIYGIEFNIAIAATNLYNWKFKAVLELYQANVLERYMGVWFDAGQSGDLTVPGVIYNDGAGDYFNSFGIQHMAINTSPIESNHIKLTVDLGKLLFKDYWINQVYRDLRSYTPNLNQPTITDGESIGVKITNVYSAGFNYPVFFSDLFVTCEEAG